MKSALLVLLFSVSALAATSQVDCYSVNTSVKLELNEQGQIKSALFKEDNKKEVALQPLKISSLNYSGDALDVKGEKTAAANDSYLCLK